MVGEATADRLSENRLLAALSAKDRALLLPRLEILTLFPNESVHRPGEEFSYVYFPLDCIVVLISSVEPHASVEVGLIGNESMVGAPVLMGARKATNEARVLSEGKALRLPAKDLIKEAKRSGTLRSVLLPFAHALLAQSSQLAACHRYHTPQARLVRLLLMSADRSQGNEFKITQETLADLLGTRRATVTSAANKLQRKGLIHLSRGRVKIIDRTTLESEACGCYQRISQQSAVPLSDDPHQPVS